MVHYAELRKVIDQLFKNSDSPLINHQIESYDYFIDTLFQSIMQQYNPTIVYGNYNEELGKHEHEIHLKFGEIALHPPMIHESNGLPVKMTPEIARLRNLTYSSNVHVDIIIETVIWKGDKLDIRDTKSQQWDKILIGKIPIMVKSRFCEERKQINPNECNFDHGGYFIITGSEKVIISQERQAENIPFCLKATGSTKFSHIVEVKSVPKNGFCPAKNTTVKLASKGNANGNCIYVIYQGCKKEIPFSIVFRALGVESDKEMADYIFGKEKSELKEQYLPMLYSSFEEGSVVLTQPQALEYISKNLIFPIHLRTIGMTQDKKICNTRISLKSDLLPHLGESFEKKRFYLGSMLKKLMLYSTGRKPEDDRDSFENKRVDTPGIMLANLLRQSFTKLIKDISSLLSKEINTGVWKLTDNFHNIITNTNINKLIKATIIEANIKYSLATGNWGVKNTTAKVGVAQVLQRLSYLGTLSHLRRVNTPIDKTSKMVKPRNLHTTTFGYICPCETPEGAAVGFVKNLALSSSVTITKPENNIIRYVNEFPGFSSDYQEHDTLIFINGDVLGTIDNMIPLIDTLKSYRRSGIIHCHTGIIPYFSTKELHIFTCGGRLIRPLFIVKDNKLVFGEKHIEYMKDHQKCWDIFLYGDEEKGIESAIEYVDVQESSVSMICEKVTKLQNKPNIKYTHSEIDPSLILGILATNIPFSDHNQAPRNCYQCLDKDEEILMANGNYKAIGDVKVGDNVVTFDPETMETSTTDIVYQHVSPTVKPIMEVTTVSGRKIIATFDHKFMTTDGWKEVRHFDKDTLIGVFPHRVPMKHTDDDSVLLSEAMFRRSLEQKQVKESLIVKYTKIFKKLELLPLKYNDKRLPTIAGIVGFEMSDGSLNVYDRKNRGSTPQCQFDFGSKMSAKEFENDVESLGFNRVKYVEGTREVHGWFHHTFAVCHSSNLALLLISLGVQTGKKTGNERKPIPEWIMNGSDSVKREFLSAFQGGDGSEIRWNNYGCETFTCAGINQTIEPEYENSLLNFMEQLSDLYECFRIKVLTIRSKIDRRNNSKVKVFLPLSSEQSNLINLYEKIGYKYDDRKEKNSALVVEYLKGKLYNGRYNQQLEYHQKFEHWKNTVVVKNYSMFIPIQNVKEISNRLISDITTASECHSFITKQGLASSNSAMAKQSMGLYSTKFNKRMDTLSNILWYPSTPLVMTHNSKYLNMKQIPNGSEVIIAVGAWAGFNQEDSLIFNKSSIDRGLFRSSFFRTYHVDEKKNQSTGEEEQFSKPDPMNTIKLRPCNYESLDEKGFPIVGKRVVGGDAIVGKTVPLNSKKKNTEINEKEFRDNSVYLRQNEDGVIDKVSTDRNGDGYVFCKVKVRSERRPGIGDKFSSCAAQKGTVGMIYPAEDMPYTQDGIVPDLVMNPHAYPSRMTFGQLLECLMGLECVNSGMMGDGTPFTDINMETIGSRLKEKGFDEHGESIMYSGTTGKKFEGSIFIGPVFYQRLKHMVEDKIHARSKGPVVNLTRQPSEGRARDGGLRIGEMEKDAIVAHGASQFLREKFMELSDNYTIHTNKRTGFMCAVNKKDNIVKTLGGKGNDNDDICEHRVPYAFKLMNQELQTMGIAMHLKS